MNKEFGRNLLVWGLILLVIIGLFNSLDNSKMQQDKSVVAYSDFLSEVDDGRVQEIEIDGDVITVPLSNGSTTLYVSSDDLDDVTTDLATNVQLHLDLDDGQITGYLGKISTLVGFY